MMCPHCGAEAGTSSFCPACSRLVNSPLLGMHRELAASRGRTYGAEGIAAAAAARARDLAGIRERKHAPPPSPAAAPGAPPERSAVTEAMRKALDRRERKARGRQRDERDDGAASTAARAEHSDRTHAIDDTSAPPLPPPLPQTRPTPVGPTPDRFPRPASMAVLSLLNALAALALLVLASVLWDGEHLRPLARDTMPHYLAGLGGALHLLAALGLWAMRPFGRGIQKLLALFWFFLFPFGTVYALILMAYFGTTGMKALFSGRSPRAMKAAEVEAALKTLKTAPAMALVLFVLAALPAIAVASFVSTTLPGVVEMAEGVRASLMGTPGADAASAAADPDGQALHDVQAVMQAEAAYASLGAGLYDRLECVSRPVLCLGSADPRNDIVLLDPRFAQSERNGYRFRLVLGSPPALRPAGASVTGVDGYAYVATNLLGSGRAICGDSTGAVIALDVAQADGIRRPPCPLPE